MKKITKLFLLLVAIVTWGSVANAQTSVYCSTPSGHLNDPAFGDVNSHILLTITNIDANNISVKVEPNTGGAPIDFLQVNPSGAGAVIVGTDEGALLPEYKAIINYTTPPANVTLEILWSNPAWGGRWMVSGLTVPFAATCAPATVDTEIPTAFTAAKGTELSTSVELLLNATDNSGTVHYTISYGAGPTVVNTSGTSAVQKSYVVTGLTPSTAYNFSIEAKDAAGNPASNNPQSVSATTTAGLVTSAPTPPAYSAPKVISIFSDAFANLSGTNFNPGWGQATVQSIIMLGTDNVLKYSNFNYQGTEFTHVFPIATGMKYLHIDVWTESETQVDIFPICWNGSGNEAEKYKRLTLGAADHGIWKSYDIPLTDFVAQGLTMVDVYQIKLVGTGGKTVYFDNIYFYDDSTVTDSESPTAFTATKGNVTSSSVELLLNATDNSGAVLYEITYGATTLTASGISGVQKSQIITGLNPSTAYSFSVIAKDATGNVVSTGAIVVPATTTEVLTALPTINFETVGQDWAWTLFANGDNAASLYSVVDNPSVAGVNLSPKVAKYIINAAGDPWAGLWSSNIGEFTFTAENCIVKVMVNKDVASNFTVKFEGTSPAFEIKVPNTLINQWELLTFDFTSKIGSTYNKLVIIPDFPGTRTAGSTNYYDNISFNSSLNTAVNNVTTNNIVNCYPNPVINQLTVNAKTEINEVIVRNLVGQTVKTTLVNGLEKSIDLSDFTAGNYLVTVKLANGEIATKKFVKL
ncbi:MAG TPA: T9SS type A sorting domain-containing protein [Paludibacter sp.]|nr:T9SS type A sorting domain-containing protein [Paludibacter sp.]